MEMLAEAKTVQFGPFALDLRTAELKRASRRVRLQGQAFQVLAELVARPGELVTREELAKKLWPGNTFVDFDSGLNTVVKRLRDALGDSADRPLYIETLPRLGYRFIGEVNREASVDSAVASGGHPAKPTSGDNAARYGAPGSSVSPGDVGEGVRIADPSTPPSTHSVPQLRPFGIPFGMTRLSRRAWVFTAAAALLVVAGAGWWRRADSTAPQINSLAVLPLANQTGDAAQNYFVDGMTDELTTSLAQLGGLRVVSETSAMHYRGTARPIREIAHELGVDAIVEGAVARSGGRVRITAQLIDARDDRHLWAESYERSGGDVLGLQHEVARAVADQIRITLTPAEAERLQTLPTRNAQAYDAFLRARYFLRTSLESEADNRQAIAAAEQAVALDPDFAEAYVAAARGYSDNIFLWSGTKEEDEEAFVALDKALALKPDVAEAYLVRSTLYTSHLHGFDLADAVANAKRSIAINPNYAEGHQFMGHYYMHAGLHDRAIEELKTSLKLDPMDFGAKYRISRVLWQEGKFEESVKSWSRYDIKDIEEAIPLFYLGRRQQAWELISRRTPQPGNDSRHSDLHAIRALLYASEGKSREAEREIQETIRLGKGDDHFHHAAFIIAAAYAEMGRAHEAVEWLRRTAKFGMPNYPLFRDNPSIKKIAGNSEYEHYMAELRPRWEQFSANL